MDHGVSLYHQVARTLRARILNMVYSYHEILPPEKELEEAFGVSNITIRKALALLVKEGLVERKRAVGTKVIYQGEKRHMIKLSGTFQDWYDTAHLKVPYKVDVLEIRKRESTETVQQLLELNPEQKVWFIRRLRSLGDQPASYYIDIFPTNIVRNISAQQLKQSSLIEIIQSQSNRKLAQFTQNVQVKTADIDIGKILRIKFGRPIFFVETVFMDTANKPALLCYWFFRGDIYSFSSTMNINL